MDDWERHVTPLLQDMGCASEDAQDDFFSQQDDISRLRSAMDNDEPIRNAAHTHLIHSTENKIVSTRQLQWDF